MLNWQGEKGYEIEGIGQKFAVNSKKNVILFQSLVKLG